MKDQQGRETGSERRSQDRRQVNSPDYTGPERRKFDRRSTGAEPGRDPAAD